MDISVFKKASHSIYLFGLAVLLAGLPLGNFLVSLGGIIVIFSSIITGDFGVRFRQFKKNKVAWLLTSIFGLAVVGTAYSSDMNRAIHELRMALPILLFPFVFATMPKLTKKQCFILLHLFVLAVLANSFISFFGYIQNPKGSYRDIVMFISHIRFSLMLVLAVHILAFYFLKKNSPYKIFAVAVALWFTYFLNLYESATGFIVLVSSIIVGSLYVVLNHKNKRTKIVFMGLCLVTFLGAIFFVSKEYKAYFTVNEDESVVLDLYTALGEEYQVKKTLGTLENGNYLYRYYAPHETMAAWDKVSNIKHDKEDENGHPLFGSLIRYMTSKGLRKDANGIHQLTEEDILNVQQGQTNYRFSQLSGWKQRLHQVFYELDRFRVGFDPSDSPTIRRLHFWEAAIDAIKQSPIFGVGTGDIKVALIESYQRLDSPLDEKSRKLVHNQFLTVMLQYGALGLLWFLFVLFYPIIGGHTTPYLGIIFLFVFLISCISEDTLNTQAGMSFFTVFYCFFIITKSD